MDKKHNPNLVPNARNLRKNMTKEERHLWFDFLRAYPIRFKRQKIIGNYIADFYCSEKHLIIELDGSQHSRDTEKDAIRTAYFNTLGIQVIRIPNNTVNKKFEAVCQYIDQVIKGDAEAITDSWLS